MDGRRLDRNRAEGGYGDTRIECRVTIGNWEKRDEIFLWRRLALTVSRRGME